MTAVTTAETASAPADKAARAGGFAAFRLLALAAVVLIGAAFFFPTWWVSLKAPNYPEHTFPDGIRIHFHVDGVQNGCVLQKSKEVEEKEGLDCVHEMDTINHFVGMYPIASGGPVEKTFSPFLFGFLCLLALGFAIPGNRTRVVVMGTGFAAVAVWMGVTLYMPGGVKYQSGSYIRSMVASLGQAEETKEDESMHPIVRQLKESLAKSGIVDETPAVKPGVAGSRSELIAVLKGAFEKDQANRLADRQEWTGTGMQLFAWHYDRSLNRWFMEPEKNNRLIAIMTSVANILFASVLAAMLAFLWMARDDRKGWFWFVGLVPMILPVAFLAEYSAWLWWYGHSLNAMGAFTLKPFMPTVLGQGKVAQFTTYSYPHIGFGLMVAAGLAMALALILRRNALIAAGK
ncbi:MAG: hypothetical protein JNM13_08700 [Hyphomicrobiaceae bacterium]|nr:hypothetical protein [Hyphomicrobiaceae bacterium]